MLESNEIFFVNANPVTHVWEIYTLLYWSRKTLYRLELQFTKEVNFMKLFACKPQIKKFQFHKRHRLLRDFLVYAWSSNTCLLNSWTVFPLSDVSYCDSDSVIDVGLWDGVCVISSVLSCHTKIWSNRQTSVTTPCYSSVLFRK